MDLKYLPANASLALIEAICDSLQSCRRDYESHLKSTAAFGAQRAESEKEWFPDTRGAKQATQYFFAVTYRLISWIAHVHWIKSDVWRIEGCKGDFCKDELRRAFPKASVETKENLVDLSVVVDEQAKEVWLAAELEIDKQPADAAEDKRDEDFRKLLNCTAIVKIFICRSQNKDDSPHQTCEDLTTLLRNHSRRLSQRGVSLPSLIGVVVFPTEARRYAQVVVRVVAVNEAGETEAQDVRPFENVQLSPVARGRPPMSKADVALLNESISQKRNTDRT